MDASLKEDSSAQHPSIFTKLKSNGSILAFYVTLGQQITGLNAVSIYGSQITRQASSSVRDLVPSLVNCINLFSTLLSSYTLHNYGRKELLSKGNILLGISILSVTVGLNIQSNYNFFGTVMIVAGLCFFSFTFGISVGPTVWLYMAEVADTEIMPYAICYNRFIAFLTIALFPYFTIQIFNNNSSVMFAFFTVSALILCPLNSRWLVQTRNKQEHQIRKEVAQIKFCK